MVPPQKVGNACKPVAVLTTVAAPPAREELPARLVGQANGSAMPPWHTCGALAKIPLLSRAGLSYKRLFQIGFSKNNPPPPRIMVFPLPSASQINPACGARFRLGLLILLPKPAPH